MFNLFFLIHMLVFVLGSIGITINREKKIYILLSIILTSLSIVRFDVGFDYFWYWIVGDKTLENNLIVNKIFQELEFGIQKIYELTRLLGHPQYFFIITGLLTFYYIYKGIYKDSFSPLMSLVIFIKMSLGFFETNHIIMQYICVAIIFYNTKLILKKKRIKYILIVLLCSFLFHSSAILGLIFLFIPKKKIDIKILLLLNCIVYFNLKVILPIVVSKILPQYLYLFYYGREGQFTNLGNLRYQLLIILIYIIVNKLKTFKNLKCFFSNEKESNLQEYYFNLFTIGTLLSLDLEYVFPGDLSRRVDTYFVMYGFVLFGNIFNLFNKNICKNLKLFTIFIIFVMNIRASLKHQGLFLNKKPYINEKEEFIVRPASNGFKIFFGKGYNDMDPYLPGDIKFYRD